MKNLRFSSVLLACSVLIGACSSGPAPTAPTNSNSGRYSISQDRAPNRDVNLSQVPEVVPVPVKRTMAGNRSPYTVLGKSYSVMPSEDGYSERGVASWYGEKFHGHKTSNGEVFDMYLASAAHKSLPIPSFLQVTNLDNNRSIIVRVNDRGPFHGDRLIDLSYAAAVKLGYADLGTARVQLDAIVPRGDINRTIASNGPTTVLATDNLPGTEKYLQVGAYSQRDSAEAVSAQLRTLTNRPVFIRSVQTLSNGTMHRVRIGPVNDIGEIDRLSRQVISANLGNPYTVTE
ncbi:MAG: rare lipoprotein A [Pseudohongiellaceae bacterium]|jgi:rare lipoprotein A